MKKLGAVGGIGAEPRKDDNRASAIVELKLSSFTNGQSIQYKVGTTVLNAVYSWNTGVTIEQNAAILMKEINKYTVTTDVSASPWWSNNASGTLYMELKYSQPGNWKGQTLAVYVNGVLGGLPGHQPKRAMGYGTCRGNDIVGTKSYELANHLGNVLAVISDRKWAVDDGVYNTTTGIKTSSTADGLADYYTATVVSYSDYDPFGTIQDGRKGNETSYRFGYQGSEKDDELKGSGNSYTTTNRLLDPRIGRWFTTDPIDHPWQSPYSSMDNNPICHNDPLGLSTSGKDKKPKTYNNPEKQARKDAKSAGLNGNNSSLTRYSDGSILVQSTIVGDDEVGGGIGIEKMYYRSSKWGTRQFHNQQVRNKARADANQTCIMAQLWGNGRGSGTPGHSLFWTDVNNPAYPDWLKTRAKMAALDRFVEGYMYTAVAVCTGGAIGLELYGSGLVSTAYCEAEFAYVGLEIKTTEFLAAVAATKAGAWTLVGLELGTGFGFYSSYSGRVTEALIQRALRGSTMRTTQGGVSLPIVQRQVRMLESGSPAPAIRVADGVLIEGNHRYVSGRVFGVEPPMIPGTISPSQLSRVVPIQNTVVSPIDWEPNK